MRVRVVVKSAKQHCRLRDVPSERAPPSPNDCVEDPDAVADSNSPGRCPFTIHQAYGKNVYEHAASKGVPGKLERNRHGGNERSTNLLFFDGHAETWNVYERHLFDNGVYGMLFPSAQFVGDPNSTSARPLPGLAPVETLLALNECPSC